MASKRTVHDVSEVEEATEDSGGGDNGGSEEKKRERTGAEYRVRGGSKCSPGKSKGTTRSITDVLWPTTVGRQKIDVHLLTKVAVYSYGGDVRRRGNQIRKEKHVRTIECAAHARATMQPYTDEHGETKWRVVMTLQHTEHNHPVSERHFAHYAENRALSKPELLAKAVEYHEMKSPVAEIMKFLQKRSDKPVIAKDVQNLLQKSKQTKRQGTVEARLDRVLKEFCEQDSQNVARVLPDEHKKATCVIFQTHAMRKMMSVFPEVLMIDATHDTNNANYKLFSFLVHDAFGHGQFVNHALIDGETKRNFSSVLAEFKASNPAWEKIAVVIVDKSFAEIAAIEAELPSARILLCQFHVLKYVGEKIAETTFGLGVRDATDKQKLHSLRSSLKEAFKALTYAASEDEYEKMLAYMRSLIPESDEGKFMKYFTKNWDQRRDLWVTYTREDIPHLGNNTNNRIESAWSHLKPQLDENAPIDETVLDIIACQGIKQSAFDWKVTDIRARIHEDYDSQMQSLLRMVSHNAADLVYPEYIFATKEKKSKPAYNVQLISKELISFRKHDEDSVAHTVNVKTSTCTCKFHLTLLLPCRHIIIARRTVGRSIIPLSGIVTRWLIRSTDVDNTQVSTVEPFRVMPLARPRSSVLRPDAKYREARQVTMSVVDVLTQFGTDQFNSGILKFHQLLSELKRGGTRVEASTQTDEYWSEPISQVSLTQIFADESIFPRAQSPRGGEAKSNSTHEVTKPASTHEAPTSTESSDEATISDDDESSDEAEWQPDNSMSPVEDHSSSGHGSVDDGPTDEADQVPDDTNRGEFIETPIETPDQAVPRDQEEPTDDEPPFKLRPSTKVLGKPQRKTKQRSFMGNASVASTRYLVEVHSNGEEVPTIAEIEADFLSSSASLETLRRMTVYPVKKMTTMYPKVHGGMYQSQQLVSPVRYVLDLALVQQCMKALDSLSKSSGTSGGSGTSDGSGTSGASGASGVVDVSIGINAPVVPGVHIHGLGVISQGEILSMRSFYNVKEELRIWKAAVAWVKDCKFQKPAYVGSKIASSAEQVAAKISTLYRRDTMTILGLIVLAQETFAYREKTWLNDLCIDLAILRVIDTYGGSQCKYVAPTLLAAQADECITPLIERRGVVIYPMSISNKHWCVMILNFDEMDIVMYDPLQVRSIYAHMSKICKTRFAPYLKGTYANMAQKEVRDVKQQDGDNCGVFVISFVERYIRGKAFLDLDEEDIRYLRLSYICMLFTEE